MAKVSLSQASKDTGVPLPTLSRWRKSGKFSGDKNPHGEGYLIDTSEYDRINSLREASSHIKPTMKGSMRESASLYAVENETHETAIELQVLREKEKLKEQRINELLESTKELKEDRDHWRNQAEKLLLTSGNEERKSPPPAPANIPAVEETPISAPQKPNNRSFQLFMIAVIIGLVMLIVGVWLYPDDTRRVFDALQEWFLNR